MIHPTEMGSGSMFQGDRYRHLNNITVITPTILEAVMFVLLIKGIYEVRC
jgi:hypothetical protein